MIDESLAIIILAAGKGTRMRSGLPKVLHRVAGETMLGHVLHTADMLGTEKLVVVTAPDMPAVQEEVFNKAPRAHVAIQQSQRGTADAVLAAKECLEGFTGHVMVMYGDTPLVPPARVAELLKQLDEHALAIIGTEPPSPKGYGRLILNKKGDEVQAIVEQKDATPEQNAITICNSGLMAVRSDCLWDLLAMVGNKNASGEYYLTDLVTIARKEGLTCGVLHAPYAEVMGVNSQGELAQAEQLFQQQLRTKWMTEGVTMVAPETVFLSRDTELSPEVVIHPNVVFLQGVKVEKGAELKSFSHFESCHIGENAVVGPYARLRPGTVLEKGVHVGNFVEVKNSHIGTGSKVNHLSYIGDAELGRSVNIGAGTITCNYDGFAKYPTKIGDHVFIGSNSALVAPIQVGDAAIVGAGSTVVEDVPPDAMAVARSHQTTIPGKAREYRANKGSQKQRLS
ncbi:bifunctional UDP-N-acetylglucosamine diphosphorylase/glucosamine-1-phosphate N-acetyltransferase GlmU [bacterium]|nr:bifunctional UDP-N-acetylglucosamine diphosphorylase/glucosamine-1-phosphate N-acetyltransferase GlmU [bacterium]